MENKIRIQPEMIEIPPPPSDPFVNDKFDRESSIKALTNVISNIEGPCVDGSRCVMGHGKNDFYKKWEQYLRNKGFPACGLQCVGNRLFC